MKIAVCIPTFNQADFLGDAVRSGLEQSGVETEIWVSDDSSTDGTREVMWAFREDPRVFYHIQPENRGIAANAAWVMRQPRTDFIVRLDSDDLLRPRYCEKLAALLATNPKAAVAHCAVNEINERGKFRRPRTLARRVAYEGPDQALAKSILGYRVAANICMFRKSSLDSLAYIYKEEMNFAEDWELYTRLSVEGWGNAYCRKSLARYRVWSDTAGYRKGRKQSEIKGLIRLFEETIEPAWLQKNWDIGQIREAKENLALNHAQSLLWIPESSNEWREVLFLLERLSGRDRAYLQNHIDSLKLSSGLVRSSVSRLRRRARDIIKAIIYR